MEIKFEKYHGTANDFIMIDGRALELKLNTEQVNALCDRRSGIGADGLIILRSSADFDFYMEYYNADGNLGSMCGNGGRCVSQFARKLNVITQHASFEAYDGPHEAKFADGLVELKMGDVAALEDRGDHLFLDTGSPHAVVFTTEDIDSFDVYSNGKALRYSDQYAAEGTNVNYIWEQVGQYIVRTYERGVEDETWSCGTGAVAMAICIYRTKDMTGPQTLVLQTKGGELKVKVDYQNGVYTDLANRPNCSLI